MQTLNLRSLTIAGALLGLVALGGAHAGATPTDNTELAKRLVAQFVQAENTMNPDLLDGIFTENYIQHDADVAQGLAGVKALFIEEFKELKARNIVAHSNVEDIVVDGDRVVLRQYTTIQKGDKRYEARGLDEWRIVDGRFGEHWDSDAAPRPVAATPSP